MQKKLLSFAVAFIMALGVFSFTAAAATPAMKSDGKAVSASITADEARVILQAWVSSHPFQLSSKLEPGSDDHIVDGVEYYRFILGIERFGVAEILVHQKTGKLFHFMSPGNTAFEPLDVWYRREHSAY
ncbi:MAG: hypothetical protein FWH34_05790 [Desulfovibrionaceae bacterium]|nr:hypothetical protein [Desulfovibrionaceae bacterium]